MGIENTSATSPESTVSAQQDAASSQAGRGNRRVDTAGGAEDLAAARSTIDQAKGVIMACFDMTDQQAFNLLRLYSSYSNTKLRSVASVLLSQIGDKKLAGLAPRQRVALILQQLTDGHGPALPAPTRPKAEELPPPASEQDNPSDLGHPLPQAKTLVRAIADAGLSITIADCSVKGYPLIYVNDAFERLTGYSPAEILGRNCRFLQGTDTATSQVTAMTEALAQGRDVRTVIRNYRRDGSGFWNELHLAAVRDDNGTLVNYIGYQADVSERVEREQQLYALAYYDTETGLPNLAHAVMQIESLIPSAASIEIRFIDFGDAAVETAGQDEQMSARSLLAQRLRAALPDETLLTTVDCNAFLVIEPDGAPRTDLEDLVTAGWAGAIDHGRTVSTGESRYPQDGADAATLVALAREKKSGGPRN